VTPGNDEQFESRRLEGQQRIRRARKKRHVAGVGEIFPFFNERPISIQKHCAAQIQGHALASQETDFNSQTKTKCWDERKV
jgi:hypothetical protein